MTLILFVYHAKVDDIFDTYNFFSFFLFAFIYTPVRNQAFAQKIRLRVITSATWSRYEVYNAYLSMAVLLNCVGVIPISALNVRSK